MKPQSYQQKLKQLPPKFTTFFVGKQYIVDTYLIYDPDTINIVIPIEGKQVTFSARIKGYDAVEKKISRSESTKISIDDHDLLRSKYDLSLKTLEGLINHNPIKVICGELDLYGRILVDLYTQNDGMQIHINKAMIDSRLVFLYDGGTKKSIQEQVQFFKNQ